MYNNPFCLEILKPVFISKKLGTGKLQLCSSWLIFYSKTYYNMEDGSGNID